MGMFDNLKVEAPLPDPEYQERTFQTKSLECSLSDYTITHEGRLVMRVVAGYTYPDSQGYRHTAVLVQVDIPASGERTVAIRPGSRYFAAVAYRTSAEGEGEGESATLAERPAAAPSTPVVEDGADDVVEGQADPTLQWLPLISR